MEKPLPAARASKNPVVYWFARNDSHSGKVQTTEHFPLWLLGYFVPINATLTVR